MLHDFVHTEKHQSKIYQQITIEDEEIRDACFNHHNGEESKNKLLPLVKHYDRLASFVCRKKPFKAISRYNWEKGEIDFKRLANELEQIQHSTYKLYQYIYHSKELKRVVESMEYGRNSLRNHLLMMVNLVINDFCANKITITNGKITTKRNNNLEKISISTSESEENHDTVKDAKMHRSLTMSNALSERATTSKTRRLGT